MLRIIGKFLAHTAATVFTIAIIFLAAAMMLLSRGPLSLEFLTPYLASALNEQGAPIQIAFSDTVLTWERKRRRLDIRIVDVRINDIEGQRIATIPQMALKLQGEALFDLRVEPERLTLIEPRIRLLRNREGKIELGMGSEALEEGGSGDLFESWVKGEWPAFANALTQVSVVDADLSFDDRITGKLWRAPSTNVSLMRGEVGVAVDLLAKLVIADRPARVAIDALYRGEGQPFSLNVDFANIEPAILALETGFEALEPLRTLRMGVSGRLGLKFDGARKVQDARFSLTAGPGVLVLPEIYATPLPVAGMVAEGAVVDEQRTLEVAQLVVDLGAGKIARFKGRLVKTDAGAGIRGQASLARLTAGELKRLWPKGFKPKSRRWFVDHISAGEMNNLSVALDIRPGELSRPPTRPDMVVMEFDFDKVTSRYWKPLPKLTGARGHGRLDTRDLRVQVTRGRVVGAEISKGEIRINHQRTPVPFAEVDFVAAGSTSEILEVLDRAPLGLARRLGLKPHSIRGRTEMRTHLKIPLKRKLSLAEIGYSAAATLTDLELAQAFGRYELTDGNIELTVEAQGMDASGRINLNGVETAMTWRHGFAADLSYPSRYEITMTLDAADRQALGLQFAPYLKGEAMVRLQVAKDRQGGFNVKGTAELAMAELALPRLRWLKPGGEPGSAAFEFQATPGAAIKVESFRIRADDFHAEGSARYGGGVNRIRFRTLRFAENEFAADVTRGPDGDTSVAVIGHALDLRPILANGGAQLGADRPSVQAPLSLTLALDRLTITDSYWLGDVRATARRQDDRWQEMSAEGALNGGSPVEIRVSAAGPGHQKIVVTGQDAGGVIASSGYETGVTGGSLTLEAVIARADNEPSIGTLRVEAFKVVDAPVLTQVLTIASITGIRDLLKGDGIGFERLEVPFQMQNDVIEIGDGRAAGAALGLTLTGKIDRGRDHLRLTGAVVPAYTINTVLGYIPLIGKVLIGREGEGVFAVRYRLEGPTKDPEVHVNALSALAPGVLRHIVSVFDEPLTIEPPETEPLVPDSSSP